MGTRNLRLHLVLECMLALLQCSESIVMSKKYEERLTGGKKAIKSAVPYVVGMETLSGQRYAGILASTDRVLTVAQLKDTCKDTVNVYLGAYEFENLKENGRINLKIPCSDVIAHSKYDPISGDNDIAMIKLPEKVTLTAILQTDQIALAKLPEEKHKNTTFSGFQVYIMGWGSRTVNLPTYLRNASSMANSKANCQQKLNATGNQICLLSTQYPSSVCTGDGGAPAFVKLRKFVIGLASRLLDDCRFRRPNIFTNLVMYIDWISDHLK